MATQGKVITITGAASGIGLITAKRFAAEGARLMLGDIAEDRLDAAVKEISALGTEARGLRVDTRRAADHAALVDAAKAAFGRLDVYVNNAGILRTAPFDELPDDEMERHITVNLLGMMHGTRAAARLMKTQSEGGHIVNVASLAGIVIVPGAAAYAASKWGIRGYTLSVAAELRKTNVRVSSICPQAVDTPLWDLGEALYAAPITFSTGAPIPPERVADAILKAVERGRLEVCVTPFWGALSRVSALFPRMGPLLLGAFEAVGRRLIRERLAGRKRA